MSLIKGVQIKKLIVHEDESGILFETFRHDWDLDKFKMQYVSVTPPGKVRDSDEWHMHKKQKCRFVCVSGEILVVLFDPKTKIIEKYFLTGDAPVMLIIPKNIGHAFKVVSKTPGYLINFPTALYNPKDELRIKNDIFEWAGVK